jgi:hypothetical protein
VRFCPVKAGVFITIRRRGPARFMERRRAPGCRDGPDGNGQFIMSPFVVFEHSTI